MGKLLLVDTERRTAEVYSKGHRNAQGLLVHSSGILWATEHGPRGGGELNRIERGANYGYPLVSYGRDYRDRVWLYSREQGRHDGFVKPVFTWLPSLGISNRPSGPSSRRAVLLPRPWITW